MHKRNPADARGITLIELVIFIVVSGIVVGGLVSAFVSLVQKGTPPGNIAAANFLGQQKIEELTSSKFASITTPNNQTVNNYGGFNGYTLLYTTSYILSNLSASPGGTPTNYTQITVQVTEPGGTAVSCNTIVTKRYYDAPQG